MKKRVHGLELEMLALAAYADDLRPHKVTLDNFLFKLRKGYGNFTTRMTLSGGEPEARAILPNQAQAYIDQTDYFEICTPECSSIRDLVIQERITKAIIRQHLKGFNDQLLSNPSDIRKLHLFASTTDARMKWSNGAHENYQCERQLTIEQLRDILPAFLIARTILEGTGLFYIKNPDDLDADEKISFCLSQRIEFMGMVFSSATTANRERPLISDRSGESLIATNPGARLHIIKGEHNQTPFGNFIKMGTVSLLIDMVEAGYFRHKNTPLFAHIGSNTIPSSITTWLNRDLPCRNVYDFIWSRAQMRLCDILDMYAEWMLDFLEKGDCGNSDSAYCDHLLYLEKLEAAQQLKRAADCFARQDIFALVGDVEWITKLWWFRDWLETEYGIEFEDGLDPWAKLDEFLPLVCRDKNALSKIVKAILWKDLFWHSLDPSESDYLLLEEYGLINPLVIDGQEIDLSTDGRFNEAPGNPPNRSSARKKLWDFMHKIGLKDFLMTDWARCWITNQRRSNSREKFYQALKYPPACPDAYEKFSWGKLFYFGRPEENDYPEVDAFIKKVKEIVNLPEDEDR